MFVLGDARLDGEKQELTVGARTVALSRKPFAVLVYLIENRHRMVDRKELLDRFWDGKEVYDQSLSKVIGRIRKELGEPVASEWIETRWGIGYRYIGPFSDESADTASSALLSNPAQTAGKSVEDSAAPPLGDDESANSSPESQRRTPSASPIEAGFSWAAKASLAALFVSLIALLVSGLVAVRRHRIGPSQEAESMPIRSVAVLPFAAGTGDDEDRYLGSELADAIAVRLGTIPQLMVRSSATVRSVIDFQGDPIVDGKKLQVQSIVKGEIRRESERVVITVHLLDSTTGAALWTSAFDEDKSNIFATEDSIAQRVSSALLPQFAPSMVKRSSGPDTSHPEAYSDYMKASFFATSRTRSSLAKAISLLNDAVRIDPLYARAYAAMANDYQLEGFYEFTTPSDAYPRAQGAALKALSLDNTLVEAHIALLSAFTDYDWDWKGAEREFKATIAIDPNYAAAYQYYGYALFGMGRGEEALATMKHAAQIDPVSPSIQTSLAWGYYLLRENNQAVDQCKRVLELYPEFVPAHQLLGIVYGQMGLNQRSMAELSKAETLEGDDEITPVLLDYELARAGQRTEAVRNLAKILTKPHGTAVPDYYVAAAWAAVGDTQRAQSFLDRAFQSRSNWVIYLHYDPRFDLLRHDLPFQTLLHQVDFSHDDSHPGPH